MNLHLKNQKVLLSQSHIICGCLSKVKVIILFNADVSIYRATCLCGIDISFYMGKFYLDLHVSAKKFHYQANLDSKTFKIWFELNRIYLPLEEDVLDLTNLSESLATLELMAFYA